MLYIVHRGLFPQYPGQIESDIMAYYQYVAVFFHHFANVPQDIVGVYQVIEHLYNTNKVEEFLFVKSALFALYYPAMISIGGSSGRKINLGIIDAFLIFYCIIFTLTNSAINFFHLLITARLPRDLLSDRNLPRPCYQQGTSLPRNPANAPDLRYSCFPSYMTPGNPLRGRPRNGHRNN